MAKIKTIYQCKYCGKQEAKWSGRCPQCGEWNALEEHLQKSSQKVGQNLFAANNKLTPLSEIQIDQHTRYLSGFAEIDQVLGGGIVGGSVTLVGGDPGIGKSTLMLQIANNFSSKNYGDVLYISGEESPSQLKLRAERLKVTNDFMVYAATDLDAVLATINQCKPTLLIIDSAQTLHSQEAGAIPGTINQIKRCCQEIITLCKEKNIACFIIAHVTKDGVIAGPKAIEHLVDTVTYFEQGDNDLRLLRAIKNRFGAVDEVGFFTMTAEGLKEANFKSGMIGLQNQLPSGSAIAATYEGSRVFLHEIQALTIPAKSTNARIYSERIDVSRALRIAAVLERHAGIRFSDQDVYINVSGGIKLSEPSIDLPLALALYSARLNIELPKNLASAGEIALSGTVRVPTHLAKRLKTCSDLEFDLIYAKNNGEFALKQVLVELIEQAPIAQPANAHEKKGDRK